MKIKNQMFDSQFGKSTLGPKGQIVIPINIRKHLQIKEGDKFLVLGMPNGGVTFIPMKKFNYLIAHLNKQIQKIKKVLDKP